MRRSSKDGYVQVCTMVRPRTDHGLITVRRNDHGHTPRVAESPAALREAPLFGPYPLRGAGEPRREGSRRREQYGKG